MKENEQEAILITDNNHAPHELFSQTEKQLKFLKLVFSLA